MKMRELNAWSFDLNIKVQVSDDSYSIGANIKFGRTVDDNARVQSKAILFVSKPPTSNTIKIKY